MTLDPSWPYAEGTEREGLGRDLASAFCQRMNGSCLVRSVISTGVVAARLSDFIAVCSLLFSSRPVILHVFCAFSSPLHPATEGEGSEREAGSAVVQ